LQTIKKAQQGQSTVDLGLYRRNLCEMIRALLTILLVSCSWQLAAAQVGMVSQDRPAEYMIYQYPNISLVVKIEAPETTFESEIYGQENALIDAAGVPSSRTGPIYQFIDAVDKPRQLMIKITPGREVERSRISMELIQLPERDWNSPAFAQAYTLFSRGIEKAHTSDSTTWSMKTYTLRNAARAFENMGWEKMRLWSEFYAAHLALHKLNDVLMAMDLAQPVRARARRAGFEEIEFAALVLEGEALKAAGDATTGSVAYERYEQLHRVLDQVVILADKLDLPSEKARALFNDGLAYEQQERMDEAVSKFRAALDVSLTTDNVELTNEIRGTAAIAYESQGSTAGAIEMLEDIGTDLDSETGEEFVENLFEKGRILNSTYRFEEASRELQQALTIQKANAASGSWGATGLALAWSWFSMGELEKARELILESIPRTELDTHRDALVRAYDVLARIHRDREQFDQVSRYRERQEALLNSDEVRARFLFESAIDRWRKDGSRSSEAVTLMSQSKRLALSSGLNLLTHRAALYECLLILDRSGTGGCSAARVTGPFQALSASGVPWLVQDAGLVRASILNREGERLQARSQMEGVLDDVLFFRQKLPGVMGSWYWLHKKWVFEEYLDAASAGSNGKQALIALDRVRLADSPGTFADKEEELRALFSQAETAKEPDAAQAADRANRQWRNLKRGFTPRISPIDAAGLDRQLSRLSRDESILSYYFGRSSAYALLASRKGVSMVRVADSRTLTGQLYRLRQGWEESNSSQQQYLDALGRTLLQPVSDALTRTIYLLPAGPLNAFPFDALRLKGAFLAENHRVINLMSLAGTSWMGADLATGYRDSVFLAGNPQAGQDLFSYDVTVSAEVTAVRDAFVGPGLNIVQGVALQNDEFKDPRFAAAGLIHLAIPGTLDLAIPDYSMLQMSRVSPESTANNLHPEDLRGLTFNASLVVLSRTAVSASARSGFDSYLGFVSDFLANGAARVLVSLQSGSDSETAVFMTDFYKELEETQNVAEALSRTRMRKMKAATVDNFMSWAGFQLYIR